MKVVGLGINRKPSGDEEYVAVVEYSKECNEMLVFTKSVWKHGIDIYLQCTCCCSCGNTWSDYCDSTAKVAEIYVSFGEGVRMLLPPISSNKIHYVIGDIKRIVETFLRVIPSSIALKIGLGRTKISSLNYSLAFSKSMHEFPVNMLNLDS